MRKSFFAAAVLALLLFALSGAAGEEAHDPATPTDLPCPHEQTRSVIYFYDTPVYTSVSSASHRVSGPAEIRTVCADCGAVLSSEETGHAEEIRPHSMRKGVCVLCGYRQRTTAAAPKQKDNPGERTLYAREDAEATGLLSLTLSGTDLLALENARVTTAVIRSTAGGAAVALDVASLLSQTEEAGANLYLELAEREDGSLFAGLYLVAGSDRMPPSAGGISLRFYRDEWEEARASLAPVDADLLVDAESIWDDRGFWRVTYQKEGTYYILP